MTLTKIPLLGVNKDDDNSIVPNGFYRDAKNIIPATSGTSGPSSLTSPRGNTQHSISMPTGTNKIIGAFEDVENNRIIYFNYNSNNDDGIYWYDPVGTNGGSLLIADLGFSSLSYITGVSVMDNVLYFTDGQNQRQVNIADVADYTPNDYELSLIKPAPSTKPTATLGSDSTVGDHLRDNSYQFRVRLIFDNNEPSILSPYSDLIEGKRMYNINDNSNNKVAVSYTVDTNYRGFVKKIQFISIANNGSAHNIFNEQTVSSGTATYNAQFYGNESTKIIPDSEVVRGAPGVKTSNVLAGIKDRLFINNLTRDYDDDSSCTLSATASTLSAASETKGWFVPGGSYGVGLVCRDEYGRSTGVIAKTTLNMPYHTANSKTDARRSGGWLQNVSLSLSGTPPSWATEYSFVRTRNQNYETFVQFTCIVLHYKKEYDGSTAITTSEVLDDGKVYYAQKQSSVDKITLKIPTNCPVSIDNTYHVRIINDIGQGSRTERIKSFSGDKVVVDNFGITDWTGGGKDVVMVEFYKPKEKKEEVYYEIPGVYSISGGAFSTTSLSGIEGDAWYISIDSSNSSPAFFFDNFEENIPTYLASWLVSNNGHFARPYMKVLTETPVWSGRTIETNKTTSEYEWEFKDTGFLSISVPELVEKKTTVSNVKEIFTPDYTKKASNLGRPYVEIENAKEDSYPNLISFSNKYIAGSNINGLSTFESLNKFPIPLDRTPLSKLQPAGNVLLAIHKRDTSVLYINENVITSSDGSEQLTKSDDVITYDRPLRGKYGTIHPESVVEHKGRVYWFDANRGEVLRYDLNGITPIGSIYKMKSVLKNLGEQLVNDSNKRVISGYDPYLDMYLITFLGVTTEQTWGFIDKQGEERWIGRFDFIPECYAKLNNKLYSFKSGLLYIHGVNSYNLFYGVRYPSEIKVLHNDNFSKEKIYNSISLETDGAWAMTSATNPEGQETELEESHFYLKDNTYFADFLRDKNTNTDLLSGSQIAIRHGKMMRSKVLDITLESNPVNNAITIDFVNVDYKESLGHRNV